MKVDTVDPVSEAVVGAQLRQVPVRLPRKLLDMGGADGLPRLVKRDSAHSASKAATTDRSVRSVPKAS